MHCAVQRSRLSAGLLGEGRLRVTVDSVRTDVNDMSQGYGRERLTDTLHHPHVLDQHSPVLNGRTRRDDEERVIRLKFTNQALSRIGGQEIEFRPPER